MNKAGMDNALSFAQSLARQTGTMLKDYFRQGSLSTQIKADRTLVTEADLAADRLINAALQQAFPKDGLLSEEIQPMSPQDPSRVWVIDPLDGTTNFSLGIPFWGVSIALLVNGWPETAAVFFPMIDEMYSAQKGEGAFFNGKPIRIEPSMRDRPGTFFACCSRTHRRYTITVPYKTRILGSAAYNFCLLSRGIALLAFEATPKIWDIAGAWLVVDESGGEMKPLLGEMPFPLLPEAEYRNRNFPTLGAISAEIEAAGFSQIVPKARLSPA